MFRVVVSPSKTLHFSHDPLRKSGKQDVASARHTVNVGTLGAGAGAGERVWPLPPSPRSARGGAGTTPRLSGAAFPSLHYDQMNVSAGTSRACRGTAGPSGVAGPAQVRVSPTCPCSAAPLCDLTTCGNVTNKC